MPKLLSIAELEKQLEERGAQVQALLKKREDLQKQIDQIDLDIQSAANVSGTGRKLRRRARIKNEMPLRPVMLGVLGKNKKGLTLAELAEKVTATGYKSTSKNFRNVLYQCLYNTADITYDAASGKYRIGK